MIFSVFSINLVFFCPWLCAINSVDLISSSDFYGPMLWLTAAGSIVSVGDVGLNTHHFWSKNPWFIWCFFALVFVPWIQWTRSLLQIFMGPCYDSQLLDGWFQWEMLGLTLTIVDRKIQCFLVFFQLIWWFFALGFVPSAQWSRCFLLQFFKGPCYA